VKVTVRIVAWFFIFCRQLMLYNEYRIMPAIYASAKGLDRYRWQWTIDQLLRHTMSPYQAMPRNDDWPQGSGVVAKMFLYTPGFPDGTYKTHKVASTDLCDTIAKKYSMTVQQLQDRNKKTWGWSGCQFLMQNQLLCVSTDAPECRQWTHAQRVVPPWQV
jgi:hypothetical protein